MRAVIVQPLYIPWMGHFGMIDAADAFVFLDQVQFEYAFWQRRNRVKMPNGKLKWLSVPVIRRFGQTIREVAINNEVPWEREHATTIRYAYSKAPFFNGFSSLLDEVYGRRRERLADLNTSSIASLCAAMGCKTGHFRLASELGAVGKRTDLLVDIARKVGADEYVSGPAAKAYLELDRFRERGMKVYWYEFDHPVYPQSYGQFIPYASALDLLFSVGPKALEYIRMGSEKALKPAF